LPVSWLVHIPFPRECADVVTVPSRSGGDHHTIPPGGLHDSREYGTAAVASAPVPLRGRRAGLQKLQTRPRGQFFGKATKFLKEWGCRAPLLVVMPLHAVELRQSTEAERRRQLGRHGEVGPAPGRHPLRVDYGDSTRPTRSSRSISSRRITEPCPMSRARNCSTHPIPTKNQG